jgi:hypothetical protein
LILPHGAYDLGNNFVWNLDTLQRFAETVSDVFLPEPGKVALATMAGTPVVDVLRFLDFTRHHATVVSALHESPKCDVPGRILWAVVTGKNRLHFPESFRVNEHRMFSRIRLPGPLESSRIERVLQHKMHVGATDRFPGFYPDFLG